MKPTSLRLETPWLKEIPDLTKPERESLKADIEAAGGIIYPVLIDENKSVIDGRNRVEIADELGLDVPTKKLEDLTTYGKYVRAIKSNLVRRHLSGPQRTKLIKRLAELKREMGEEVEVEEIAEVTGAGKTSVYEHADPAKEKREALKERRKTVTIKKYEEGMSTREIAEELGVAQSTVMDDLNSEREFRGGKTRSAPLGTCDICQEDVLPGTEHFRYGCAWIIQRVGGGPNRVAAPIYQDKYAHKACIT